MDLDNMSASTAAVHVVSAEKQEEKEDTVEVWMEHLQSSTDLIGKPLVDVTVDCQQFALSN